jgi:hypothetical protein
VLQAVEHARDIGVKIQLGDLVADVRERPIAIGGNEVEDVACPRREQLDARSAVQEDGADLGRVDQVLDVIVRLRLLLDLILSSWLTVRSSSLIDCSSSLPVSSSSAADRSSSFMA